MNASTPGILTPCTFRGPNMNEKYHHADCRNDYGEGKDQKGYWKLRTGTLAFHQRGVIIASVGILMKPAYS